MTRRKVTRTKLDALRRGRGGGRGRVGPALLGLLGLVVVAGIIAVVATGGGGDDAPVASRTVVVSGEPLPAFEEGNDPAVGLAAPTLRGEDFEGRAVTIGNDGRPKVMIFLAHWCPHCQREVPLMQDWLDREGMPETVDLYSVATAIDPAQPNYPPEEWLRREGWTVPVLVDGAIESAANAYGLTGFPFWVFVDAEGNVASRFVGELTIEQLQGYLATISTQPGAP